MIKQIQCPLVQDVNIQSLTKMNKKGDLQIPKIIVLIFGIAFVFLLFFWINNQNLSARYKNIQRDYIELNQSYNKLVVENEKLKSQQNQLTEEIASYLIEQTAIDLLGLKKYEIAYSLIKIGICNKNPSIIIC